MSNKIPFNKPFIIGKELFYLAKSITNGRISGNGQYTRACQNMISDAVGCDQVLMMPSCTAGLELAMLLIDLKPGDEVIMPSFTFVSTANAVALRGGIPVFCDISPVDFNLDVNKLKSLVSSRTRAIIPVHYAGQSCQMDTILAFAKDNQLTVVEDAAQGFGSQYKGKSLGTLGDMGTFSFHETKNIICGEGGALIVNNPVFKERAEVIQEKGTNRAQFFRGEIDKYSWVDIGSSYLPSELQMAFLLAQLERFDEITLKRRASGNYYRERLKPLDQNYIQLPHVVSDSKSNFHLFPILCRDLEERTDLIRFLREKSIHAVFHYVPLHSAPAGRKFGKTPFPLPVTEEISDRLLRLPLYHEITEAEQDRVIESIFLFFKKRKSSMLD